MKPKRTEEPIPQRIGRRTIGIAGKPVFVVEMTLDEAKVLMDLAAHHYDARCKEAGQPGPYGFIYGWSVLLDPAFAPDPPQKVRAKWRDLDTCLKIMEFNLNHRDPFTKETARRLTAAFNEAMNLAEREMRNWQAEWKEEVS